jgi:hypothetical protein
MNTTPNTTSPAASADSASPQTTPDKTLAPATSKAVAPKKATSSKAATPQKAATSKKAAAPAKAAQKVTAKKTAAAKPAAPAQAKPAAKAPAVKKQAAAPAKPLKDKKLKVVRDSFTIPKTELLQIGDMKKRALTLGVGVKKSELIRAGLSALAAMGDASFKKAIASVPTIKTGRPAKD